VLAVGVLTYIASRSLNGGWAGILLSGMVSWYLFELLLSFVRGVGRLEERIRPRHRILGGCLTLVAACGAGGIALSFREQMLLGVLLGGIAAVTTRWTRLPTLAHLAGMDLMPTSLEARSPITLALPPVVAAILALVCLPAGIALAGLGTVRVLEGYSYATDTECVHPCGMVHGLWVQVLPDARGDFVTRLDLAAVQIRLRFSSDVAGDKIADPGGFTVTNAPATYQRVAGGKGCEAWEPRVLHLGDSTGDLTLCFAIPQSQEVDLSRLVLDWAEAGVTAPILLGKIARSGVGFEFNSG